MWSFGVGNLFSYQYMFGWKVLQFYVKFLLSHQEGICYDSVVIFGINLWYVSQCDGIYFASLHNDSDGNRMEDQSACEWVISCFHDNPLESKCVFTWPVMVMK